MTGKRVVVAMSGGVDSTAAAFLLQKQGFECIGISIIFIDRDEIKEAIQAKIPPDEDSEVFGKEEKKVPIEERMKFLDNNCSAKNLEETQEICNQLNMPFYAVKATKEYKDAIIDNIVSSRLSGEYFNPCIECNNIKMNIMLNRAEKLHCDYIATGHYAKVYKDEKTDSYQIYSSNDIDNDQSYLLSHLDQQHLSRLILPLSNLRRQDVIHLMKNFKLSNKVMRDSKSTCFHHPNLPYMVEAFSHESLTGEGTIFDSTKDINMGDHHGIHKYYVGQSDIVAKEGIGSHPIDRHLVVLEINPHNKKMTLGEPENLYCSVVGVKNLHFNASLDMSKPMNVYVKASMRSNRVNAFLYFKNNNSGVIEFTAEHKIPLSKGHIMAFYDKPGVGGRVIGCATINRTDGLKPEVREIDAHEDTDQSKAERERRKKNKNYLNLVDIPSKQTRDKIDEAALKHS